MAERVHVERRLEDDRGIQRFTIIKLILIAILIDCQLDFELFGKESTPHCHKTFVKRAFGRYYFFPFCPDGIRDDEMGQEPQGGEVPGRGSDLRDRLNAKCRKCETTPILTYSYPLNKLDYFV